MTLSTDLSGPTVEPRVIRKQYAMEMAVERTRLLYQGSLLPTLFMLINGLVCAGLLWSPQRHFLVSVWLVWLLSLVALRVIQVAAFDSAIPNRQAHPIWRRMFLLGSGLTGLTLAGAGIALVPADNFIQQAWVFGLIGAAALSASVAYAVSLPAFLSLYLALPVAGHHLFILGWRCTGSRLGLVRIDFVGGAECDRLADQPPDRPRIAAAFPK